MNSGQRLAGLGLLVAGALTCFFGYLGLGIGAVMLVVGAALFARSFLE